MNRRKKCAREIRCIQFCVVAFDSFPFHLALWSFFVCLILLESFSQKLMFLSCNCKMWRKENNNHIPRLYYSSFGNVCRFFVFPFSLPQWCCYWNNFSKVEQFQNICELYTHSNDMIANATENGYTCFLEIGINNSYRNMVQNKQMSPTRTHTQRFILLLFCNADRQQEHCYI